MCRFLLYSFSVLSYPVILLSASFPLPFSYYGYYTDFKKVYENADALKVEISILGSLIGSKNIESEFEELIIKYRKLQ